MVKLIGLQTFFMTLSYPHLEWNELVSIISGRYVTFVTSKGVKFLIVMQFF